MKKITTMETKTCLECGEKIIGRIDKKFCDDQCRNLYNNRNKSDSTNLMRRINNVLRKNRRILMELSPSGKAKIKYSQLAESGFNFSYHTHQYDTKKGTTYFFCYEYGYLKTDDDFIVIVKDSKES